MQNLCQRILPKFRFKETRPKIARIKYSQSPLGRSSSAPIPSCLTLTIIVVQLYIDHDDNNNNTAIVHIVHHSKYGSRFTVIRLPFASIHDAERFIECQHGTPATGRKCTVHRQSVLTQILCTYDSTEIQNYRLISIEFRVHARMMQKKNI